MASSMTTQTVACTVLSVVTVATGQTGAAGAGGKTVSRITVKAVPGTRGYTPDGRPAVYSTSDSSYTTNESTGYVFDFYLEDKAGAVTLPAVGDTYNLVSN
jgi:hypothetical protein